MDDNEFNIQKERILAENNNNNPTTSLGDVSAELEYLRELLLIIENVNKENGGLLNDLTYQAIRLKSKIRELENDY